MTPAMLTATSRNVDDYQFDLPARDLTDSERPPELPGWFEPLVRDSVRLLRYEPGWDSHGAAPIEYATFLSAMRLLGMLAVAAPNAGVPSVVPTALGGLAFEWNTMDATLEIEINAVDNGSLYFESRRRAEEYEKEFRSVEIPLQYIRKLFPQAG